MRHALVLKDGRTLAQGAIAEVLRADVLGEAFGRPCRVEPTSAGRYRLHMD